jgi:very-short-patch-repair endonuclease
VHDDAMARVADAERQSLVEERGIRFLRFTTEEVTRDIDTILERITSFCEQARNDLLLDQPKPDLPLSTSCGEGAGG